MQIRITPGFLLLPGCFWLLGRWALCLPFLLAAALHETGHLAALWLLDIPVCALELGTFGAVIRADLSGCPREIPALAAGPCVNLLLAAVFWRSWPIFALSNLALGLGNLLPFPKRDGGRLVQTLKRGKQ